MTPLMYESLSLLPPSPLAPPPLVFPVLAPPPDPCKYEFQMFEHPPSRPIDHPQVCGIHFCLSLCLDLLLLRIFSFAPQ